MKERMKKISILSFYQEAEDITDWLQEIGVIHIEAHRDVYNENIGQLESTRNRIRKTIDTIEQANDKNGGQQIEEKETEVILDNVEGLRVELEELHQEKEALQKEMLKLEPWGTFDRHKIAEIKEKGLNFRFFIVSGKHFKKADLSNVNYQIINEAGDLVYLVVMYFGDEFEEEQFAIFDEVELASSPNEIEGRLRENSSKERDILNRIRAHVDFLPRLKAEFSELEDKLSFQYALGSQTEMGEGKLLVLRGWYPARIEKNLIAELDKKGLSYLTAKPELTDNVPVLLRNSRYSSLFEPITRIFQLPNYYELDLTPVIAVFYPIFFAYCLGDAGYGVLVVLIALVGWFTFLRDNKKMAILALLLGGLTAIMGIIKSGSIFGLPLTIDSDVPLFRYLAQFVLVPDDQDYVFNAFNVALMFGVLQILIGIIASIANRIIYYSFKNSLSQIGKLLIFIGVLILFLADMQGVTELQPYTSAGSVMLYGGIAMVLLFNDMTVPVLKRIGGGILPLFFIFTGILGDILSYVRLFALGVASSVLGLVVNRIGMQIMGDEWWSILIAILFLIFGHVLNLSLAVLGAFVHPLRLTFVEFYNNAEFKGGGIEYKPFKKLNKDLNRL